MIDAGLADPLTSTRSALDSHIRGSNSLSHAGVLESLNLMHSASIMFFDCSFAVRNLRRSFFQSRKLNGLPKLMYKLRCNMFVSTGTDILAYILLGHRIFIKHSTYVSQGSPSRRHWREVENFTYFVAILSEYYTVNFIRISRVLYWR